MTRPRCRRERSRRSPRYTRRRCLPEGDQTTAQGHTPLRWSLWRDDQRVETRTVRGVFSVIWSRDSEGRISKEQVFPDERAVVDYYPGRFRCHAQSAVVASSAIPYRSPGTRNRPEGSKLAQGNNWFGQGLSRHARRRLDGSPLVSFDLASVINRDARDQSRRIVTRLIETWPVNAAPVPRSKTETLAGYRRVNFADFGRHGEGSAGS